MKIKCIRGLSIVEMLVATSVLALVIPMVMSIFVNVVQDYESGVNYIAQQDSINSTFMNIRSDFERSSSANIKLISGTNISEHLAMSYTNPDTAITDDKIAKKFYFKDDPIRGITELRVINSESGTPQDVMVLDNIRANTASGGSGIQKSAINVAKRSTNAWDIWMEIWFKDINEIFFKGRNYGAPVIIRFETSNKNIIVE